VGVREIPLVPRNCVMKSLKPIMLTAVVLCSRFTVPSSIGERRTKGCFGGRLGVYGLYVDVGRFLLSASATSLGGFISLGLYSSWPSAPQCPGIQQWTRGDQPPTVSVTRSCEHGSTVGVAARDGLILNMRESTVGLVGSRGMGVQLGLLNALIDLRTEDRLSWS
jgi:hypothetical protein